MTGAQNTTARPGGGRADASDIPRGTWIDRWMPRGLRGYLRLARIDRPIGTWLLLWPCWWGVGLAAAVEGALPPAWMLALFGLGAILMRGAGCTYNDIVDRRIDAQVARTATRPIPSGEVPLAGAVALLAGLCLAGLAVLLQFNEAAVAIGLASVLLVAAYPFMKRITYWPQAWLGLTFNWGALVGWAAVTGGLAWPALVLYAGGFCWTLGYDTIYAHQDKEDDALIGVKSTALKFGERSKPWLVLFYAASAVLLAAAGWAAGAPALYYLGVAAAAAHFAWQVGTLDLNDHRDCLTKFKSNLFVGALVFAGLLVAALS